MNTLKFGNGEWYGKKDTILAYNDLNSNFKPLAFNFERNTSATVINKEGLIETVGSGEPRIDYKDDSKGALLLEPSRSNAITYSSDFNNASWLKTNLNITKDIETAPNGLLNASKILQTVSGGYARINTTLTGSETFSLFAKKGDLTDLKLFLGGDYAYFDLENGLVLFASGSNYVNSKIESFNNGWYRCSITSSYSGGSSIRFQGTDGTNDNSLGFIYTYGAQLEQGSYATSYIPTQGGVVTRVAESCNGAGNEQVFNDSEGVLYAEISALANDLTYRSISISGHINLFYNNVSNTIVVSSTGGALIIKQLSDITSLNKIALKYKANDFALWVNGVELGTDTSATTSNSLTTLNYDNGAGGSKWYGSTKQIQYYNTALTYQELQALTTI